MKPRTYNSQLISSIQKVVNYLDDKENEEDFIRHDISLDLQSEARIHLQNAINALSGKTLFPGKDPTTGE